MSPDEIEGEPKAPFSKPLFSFLVSCLCSGIVCAMGEGLCLIVTGKSFRDNRFLRWFMLGFLVLGTCLRIWYTLLNTFCNNDVFAKKLMGPEIYADLSTLDLSQLTVTEKLYGSALKELFHDLAALTSLIVKVTLDQLLWAPVCCIMMLSLNNWIDHSFKRVDWEQVKPLWWPACKTNWILWIPVQLVNFAIVPFAWQVLFANTAAVVWNAYLALVTRIDGHPKAGHKFDGNDEF